MKIAIVLIPAVVVGGAPAFRLGRDRRVEPLRGAAGPGCPGSRPSRKPRRS